jgi:hypothetical protein
VEWFEFMPFCTWGYFPCYGRELEQNVERQAYVQVLSIGRWCCTFHSRAYPHAMLVHLKPTLVCLPTHGLLISLQDLHLSNTDQKFTASGMY